ncbi:MAG: HisA/HisF-related TIM barrel protein [Gemmataceae bacterium]
MRILPVLDIQQGVVVRGVGGRRQEYRPVVSKLTTSARPVDVALAFRDHFGFEELYLADLDAIAGAPPAFSLYTDLHQLGFRLWIDAGVRDEDDAHALAAAGVEHVIAGLETLPGPETLAAIGQTLDGDQVVFSLDLRGGQPLAAPAWGARDPWHIAVWALDQGIRRLLVLDLARVGEKQGTGTEDLCSRLHRTYPDLFLLAGGGVRHRDDLRRLRACGVQAALVASSLHDGQLTAETVRLGSEDHLE